MLNKTLFKKVTVFLLIMVLLINVNILPANAAATVTVNVASILNDISAQKIGINTNTWTDGQGNRVSGARTLSTALNDMGVKFMRFPGGEKSDGYLWSTPPYTAPNPKLARISSQDWPSNDTAYWSPAGDPNGSWVKDIYDFDEFMVDCRAAGAEPVIVVAYDGIYKPAYAGGTSLTYQQALDTAVAWVKYANITKGYNVKYWTIGNETWFTSNYMGANPGNAQYGKDASAFAKAMKAIDPTIKVGINGDTTAMFDGVLANCASDIDFLDIHGYPAYTFVNYASYKSSGISFKSYVDAAQNSINKLAEPNKSKMFIINTEVSAATYGLYGTWTNSDAGHGLVDTELFLSCLNDSRLKFSLFWNTHWIDSTTGTSTEFNALNQYNNLTADGLAIKVLNSALLKKMVATTSSSPVVSSASYDPTTGDLNLILINRDTVATATTVNLQNYTAASTGTKWVYKGTSSTDTNPTYTQGANVSVSGNTISVSLDPVSVTVIKLKASTTTPPPTGTNLITTNPGFESGTAATGWAKSGTASIVNTNAYSGTYAARLSSSSSGYYRTITGLKPNTSYTLTAYGKLSATGQSSGFYVKNFGGTNKSVAITGTSYAKYTITFTTGASSTSAEIVAWKTSGSGYTYVDDFDLR